MRSALVTMDAVPTPAPPRGTRLDGTDLAAPRPLGVDPDRFIEAWVAHWAGFISATAGRSPTA